MALSMKSAASVRPSTAAGRAARARPRPALLLRASPQQQQHVESEPSTSPNCSQEATLLWVKSAIGAAQSNSAALALPLLVLGGLALAAEPSLAEPTHQYDLAEGQEVSVCASGHQRRIHGSAAGDRPTSPRTL